MNQAVLITGAARGIGRGIALELAKEGCDLVINYAGNLAVAQQTSADCIALAQARQKSRFSGLRVHAISGIKPFYSYGHWNRLPLRAARFPANDRNENECAAMKLGFMVD